MEREGRSLRDQDIPKKAECAGDALEQAVGPIRRPSDSDPGVLVQCLSEPPGTVQMLPVSGQSEEEEEDVSGAGDPVADPRPLGQESLAPDAVAHTEAGLQVLGVLVHEECCMGRKRNFNN